MSTRLRSLVEHGRLYLFLLSVTVHKFAASYLHTICCEHLQNTSSSLHFNGHFPGEPELAGVY